MTWKTLTNEQKTHLIKSIWREGISAREIANAIGTTKSSVIGHYSRHKDGLVDAPLPMSPREKNKIGLVSDATIRRKYYFEKAKNKDEKQVSHTIKLSFPTIEHDILPIPSTEDDGLYVTLAENDGCMWPLNDGGPYLFCGHVKLKGSYCGRHHVRSMGVGTESERRAHKIGERHV